MAILLAVIVLVTINDFLEGNNTITCGSWLSRGLDGCTSEVLIGLFFIVFFGMFIFAGIKEQKKIRRYSAGKRKSKRRKKQKR